ncbi:hypothetical protein PVAG01_05536 [Phlyctema vagabunda]|uniref:N-acetyltransferase domain-containing protein n=1 Tax=Phlyctema vagabunda TaxID=108571 RepID=A0ABR4PKD7_9HELO
MAATTEPATFTIRPATSAADLQAIRTLFSAYMLSLGLALDFHDFPSELASLPGKYAAAQGGTLLVAVRSEDQRPMGCVALRPLNLALPLGSDEGARNLCEIKRLYCVPEARGEGVGNALVDAVLERATNLGYAEVRLETLPHMAGPRSMYRKRGFREIAPYYASPLDGPIFLAKGLRE